VRTRCEAYFLTLFGSATLRGAAEAAAQKELAAITHASIPIDIYSVAARKRFTILEDLAESGCAEGELLPVRDGYRVRLRRTATEARKRFSVAHEIGHTFFYRDEGEGPRHTIGVMNATERIAEEKICNLFAGTLLMPAVHLRKHLQLEHGSPAAIVSLLQRAASNFKVSMPSLLTRLRALDLEWPACLLVCSSFRPNPKTGLHPKLRIDLSIGLGGWSNRQFWNGTPVADANISSAVRLYAEWTSDSPNLKSGQFVMGSRLEHNAIPSEQPEREVLMSRRSLGLWKREAVACISSSALYSWGRAETRPGAYVLTAISPTTSCVTD
jgi:hypothetical protein